MRKLFGFFMGILIGGLVGAAAALLFAPGSGAELRESLRERGSAFLADVRHAADTRRMELRERLADLRAPRES